MSKISQAFVSIEERFILYIEEPVSLFVQGRGLEGSLDI
jgi:hypothetical protein